MGAPRVSAASIVPVKNVGSANALSEANQAQVFTAEGSAYGAKCLSPREEQIVELCIEGLTNEAIAHRLGLSVGTINTYWLRIKLKVGGSGRTAAVARLVKGRALKEADVDRQVLAEARAETERRSLETLGALALLKLAMSQMRATVWATDGDLLVHLLENGESPPVLSGIRWAFGMTVYDLFKTRDPSHPGIAAHAKALQGIDCEVRLLNNFENSIMRVTPLKDNMDYIVGCISILYAVAK